MAELLLDDLEDELMDLETNESAYLPNPHTMRHSLSSRSSFTGRTSFEASDANVTSRLSSLSVHSDADRGSYSLPPAGSAPAPGAYQHQHQQQQQQQQLQHQYQQQQHYQQQQPAHVQPAPAHVPRDTRSSTQPQARNQPQLQNNTTSPTPALSSTSTSSLSLSSMSASSVTASITSFAASLGLRTQNDLDSDTDEQWLRKKAALSEITRLRQQQITERVGQWITSTTVRQETWDPNIDAMTQMTDKLDAVIEASLLELRQPPAASATLWTQVLAELPPQESDYMAKAADEKFEEQMKYCASRKVEREIHKCIEHHLEAILVSSVPQRNGFNMGKAMNHSLGQLLKDFRSIFFLLYENFVVQYQVHQVADVLPLVSADILLFSSILVQLLMFKYAFLSKWKEYVRRCVIAVLFELLQPTLHGLYVGAFKIEDSVMQDIASLKRMNPPADFGIAPIFRLDGNWQPGMSSVAVAATGDASFPEASRQQAVRQYAGVIYKMNNLASIRSPWVKIETLASICREIDATIKAYYAQQPVKPSNEEININADDLRAILAFVLVSSPSMCLHVFSQLAILSSFMPQASATGEEGFALATFTSAVRLVARLPSEIAPSHPIPSAHSRSRSHRYMPPKRRATTPRRNTLDGPGHRKRHRWQSDNTSRHSRSSLDVLLAWLTAPGNYSRWAARASLALSEHGGRLALCREINALLKAEGITHRKDMDIYAKVGVIEKSFHAAKKWLEETSLMPKFLQGTAGKDVDANVDQLCRHYKELAPAFAATSNEAAASKVVDITQRSSSDEDEDDGGKSDTTTSTDDAEANEEKQQCGAVSNSRNPTVIVNGSSIATASKQRQQHADKEIAANGRSKEVISSQPEELYTMSPVHNADATASVTNTTNTTTAHGNGTSRPGATTTTTNTMVRDEYEETKENEPEPETSSETEQRATPPTAPPSSSSASPPKQFKRIRQRRTQQDSDEDSEPLGTPVQQMPAAVAALSSTSTTPTKTTCSIPTRSTTSTPTKPTPAKRSTTPTKTTPSKTATTPTKSATAAAKAVTPPKRASSPASTRSIEKPSIAPKRKTSDALKEAIATSSTSISPSASARKKQKTQLTEPKKTVRQLQQEEEKKKKQQQQRQEPLKTTTIATRSTKVTETTQLVVYKSPEKQQKQQQQHQLKHHPEELQAILRACEEEREQRHALFQLQCDKLMQELEEKKIKVVYETALARKKLLDVGVAQSEVDRILPL